MFSRICPELAFDRFGYFATFLARYADEIDSECAHERLEKQNAPANHPGWQWAAWTGQHFTECPIYSVLSHRSSERMKEITEEPESKWRPETISLIQRKIAREAKAFHNALGNALNDALQLFEVNRRASIPLCLNHFRHASAKALVNYSDAVRSVILSTLEK